MRDAVKLGATLVVGHHDIPWCKFNISDRQHRISGSRVVVPPTMGFKVHWTKLPNFATVMNPRQESARLLLLAHFNPILDQNNSRTDESVLGLGTHAKKVFHLFLGAKAHQPLDQGAVVPAPVEDHDLARSGQMRNIALDVHLRLFALGRGGQGNDAEHTGADALRNPLDDASFARRIAPLEDDERLKTFMLNSKLELHEFDVQLHECLFEFLALELRGLSTKVDRR